MIALLAEEGDDLSKVEIPKTQAAPKAEVPAKEEKKEAPGRIIRIVDPSPSAHITTTMTKAASLTDAMINCCL